MYCEAASRNVDESFRISFNLLSEAVVRSVDKSAGAKIRPREQNRPFYLVRNAGTLGFSLWHSGLWQKSEDFCGDLEHLADTRVSSCFNMGMTLTLTWVESESGATCKWTDLTLSTGLYANDNMQMNISFSSFRIWVWQWAAAVESLKFIS